MPYKDPEKERQRSREKYYRKKAELLETPKPAGVCSVQDCLKPSAEGRKKCEHHLEYMREYRRKHRKTAAEKEAEGICTGSDCTNTPEDGRKTCGKCRARTRDWEGRNKPAVLERHTLMRRRVKSEMLAAYGGLCLCCGEDLHKFPEFASLDHVGGHDGSGPRKGDALYAWAKRNSWPDTLRLLCFNCNFSLGHHGYCVHGLRDEGQKRRVGRPAYGTEPISDAQRRSNRRAYVRRKISVMTAYGGQRCKCCGVTDFELLSIDHIGLTGADHREEVNGDRRDGRNIYDWLRRNNYPKGYRVLCHQCNFSLGHFGYCPHDNGLTP